jgi:cell division septum initiation protein DivIVA
LSDIYHLIDRLERLLNESWRMPLSAYLVINEDDFLDVIDQMRTAIPKEIRAGEKVQRERDRIIAQAEEESERIVHMAHEERDKAVEDHEVIRAADQRAATIIERAHREATILKSEADEYARSVLVALDDQLGGMDEQIAVLLTTVRNGLETLTSGPEAASDDSA